MEADIRIYGDSVFGSGGYDHLSESRKKQVHDNLMNVRAELLGSGFLSLDSDKVQNVQTPTFLVTGQRSIGLFQRLTERLEELMPYTERIEIPGASHMVHEDNPVAYNTEVLGFLGKKTQEASS